MAHHLTVVRVIGWYVGFAPPGVRVEGRAQIRQRAVPVGQQKEAVAVKAKVMPEFRFVLIEFSKTPNPPGLSAIFFEDWSPSKRPTVPNGSILNKYCRKKSTVR
jgi:hypothetical protein